MTYSIQKTCYACEKREDCKDADHIEEGVYKIHADIEHHKGSGTISILCYNMRKEEK